MKIEIPKKIIDMAVEMKRFYDAEENAATAKPLVCVYSSERIIIPDESDGIYGGCTTGLNDIDVRDLYVLEDGGDYHDFLSFDEMKEFTDKYEIKLKKKKWCDIFNRYEITDIYEIYNSQLISVFQAAFFTVRAANAWIEANLHNLNKPFVYIHSTTYMSKGWQEMETIYDFMMEVARGAGESNEK